MAFTVGAMKTWKNLASEESFFLSGFWGFGAFSENLLNPRQRASIKVSTVTRPQTMLVAPLLPTRLLRVTTRHVLRPGFAGGEERGKKLSPPAPALGCKPCIPHTTSPASPTPRCTSSSVFPHSPLATRLPSQDSLLTRRAAGG